MQGDASAAEPLAGEEETAVSPAAELRPIKTDVTLNRVGGESLLERPFYWLLWLLPLLLVLAVFYRGGRGARGENEDEENQVVAPLSEALQQLEGTERPFEQVPFVISGYLSRTLRQPVAGLSTAARARLLAEHGVSEPLIRRLIGVLAKGEFGRFAPDGLADEDGLLDEARGVLQALDEVMA